MLSGCVGPIASRTTPRRSANVGSLPTYLHFYNCHRAHSAISYNPPISRLDRNNVLRATVRRPSKRHAAPPQLFCVNIARMTKRLYAFVESATAKELVKELSP